MDFEIIIQECFLGDPLPKLLKEFCYFEQNGRQGYKWKKALKKLLLLNRLTDFKIISQESSLGNSLLKLLKLFCAIEQDGSQS